MEWDEDRETAIEAKERLKCKDCKECEFMEIIPSYPFVPPVRRNVI